MIDKQTITLSIKGVDYEHSAHMTKEGGIRLDDELYNFIKSALVVCGFDEKNVVRFYNEEV